jgi:protein gp37
MGETTGIEWTDATWNPWRGCHKISPACAHCYMFREQRRYGNDPNLAVRASDATFFAPLKWKAPKRIFTCSWSDFFIEEADPWRVYAWQIMMKRPDLDFQILTKRIERIANPYWMLPIRNAWLGVSVENRRFYRRIEMLQKVQVQIRFLSIEPLLGPMPDLPLEGIHWVIVGGESGPKFRPLNLDWVREIRDRCLDRNIPFFFKQKSGLRPKSQDRLLDGVEWSQFPK